VALNAGALGIVAGSLMSIRVEEDQMDLVLNFQGNLLGANADSATMAFQVNGVTQPTLPLYGTTFLTGTLQKPANFSLHVTLAKGDHKVALLGNDVGSGSVTIDGAAFDCRFSATRVSNAAVLAHGVDSKVQGVY